ncbi:LOW QUALITY PROTEIN: hypothetical protein KUTeg_022013 [Tegillarca granosa]|uniref:Uncharacterized protein n=1 Tax=Tegillarca granosa TaxID=220873 RepID=A0ABQ9E808_TEGGR|nr:LOW QUALITY PROTEIN: hypothetical protein KUTeg_022013 [Tegillarca granosa]
MVALVVAEHRPTLDLVEAASETKTVIASFRRIGQADNIWQELYRDILTLAEKQDVQPSKPRTAGRQQHRNNMPSDTSEQFWRSFLSNANEIEERIVVPKDRFLAQYLIPSRPNSLTRDMEPDVFVPFVADLPEGDLATS